MGKSKKKSGKKSHQTAASSVDSISKKNSIEHPEDNSNYHVNEDSKAQSVTEQLVDSSENEGKALHQDFLNGNGTESQVTNDAEKSRIEELQEGSAKKKLESVEEVNINLQTGKLNADFRESNDANLNKELQEEIQKLRLQLEEEKKIRQNLENVNSSDERDSNVKLTEELKRVKNERDQLETQYNNLLNRISSMKTVFNKMKESQEELNLVKEQLEEYESQNTHLKNKLERLNKEKNETQTTVVTLTKEFSDLDNDHSKLQEECNGYREQIRLLNSRLENLSAELSHELDASREENIHYKSQIDELMIIMDNNKQDITILKEEKEDLASSLNSTIKEKSDMQDALQDIESELEQATTKFEGDLKEKTLEIKSLRVQLDSSLENSKESLETIQNLKQEIESMREDILLKEKYEKECKDRVLQIGKLRHEAIILNEHLTKALAMLKQSSDSESVDKELISNLLISFVAIPRADPRKFEVLELISSFLNWDDDKKRQAGLIYSNDKSFKSSGSSTENFVSMWTDFLEKESEAK